MSVGSKEHLGELTLSLLVDDLLDGQETERCYDHMNQCKDCETAFENLQAISFAMAKLEDLPVPEDFVSQVMGKLPPQDGVDASKTIEIKEHRVKKSFFANLPMGQVACFAAVAMFGLTFLQNPPTLEDGMSGRGVDSATESATMTLGEGYEEDVMPSAMPMDVDGGDLRISGDVIMGESGGMAGFVDSNSTYEQAEQWLLGGRSFATSWESLCLSGTSLVPLLEQYLMDEEGFSPDVVVVGEKNPDVFLFSPVEEGDVALTGERYYFSTAVLSEKQWGEQGVTLLSEFPELVELAGVRDETKVLLVYRS